MSSNSSSQLNPAKSLITLPKVNTPSADNPLLSNSFLHRIIHDAGHDIRSPLFVIRGYTQLLQKVDDKECINRGIKLMEDASFKMEHTINGLVELMDIYTIPNVEMEKLSLEVCIEKVCSNLDQLKENASSVVQSMISLENGIFFNEKHLSIILTNLIDNSIRHNADQENLRVNISCEQITNGNILLTVEDNGKGIDALVEEDKLKKPFYKYGEYTAGVGVGLAKIEAIARMTMNEFKIESIPNQGTKCTFLFQKQARIDKVNSEESNGSR